MKSCRRYLGALGLTALALVPISVQAALREYWIAAEAVDWNYAPSGRNLFKPGAGLGPWGQHLVYRKYRYIQYTGPDYRTRVPQPRWMGILGPQLRAVEGDTLQVHFLNRTDKPLSIHPHGLRYDKANEGADGPGPGAAVPPGRSFTYTWQVDTEAAPGPGDPSSIVWVYHSHVDSVTEIYDGLIGTIVVTRRGMARSVRAPRPRDVDAELTVLFMIFDENGRRSLDAAHGPRLSQADIREGHLKHSLNGLIFGNLQGLTVTEGQRVRWYLIGMGTEADLHTAHWHGQTVLARGRRTDVVELLPTSMKTVDMRADHPGRWLFHCHVTDHITAGMITRWEVRPRQPR